MFLKIILLIIFFYFIKFTKYICTIPPIKNSLKRKILKMLYDTDQIFTRHKINYWAEGGTLLGIVRHKGPIPWDDDNDICILEEDYDKIIKLKEEFYNRGYNLIKHYYGFKISYIGGLELKNLKYTYPFLDIFIRKLRSNRIVLSRTKKWSKFYFLKDEVFPIRRYKYENFYINGPKNPYGYLNRGYPKWKHLLKNKGGHNKNNYTKKQTCFNFKTLYKEF